MNRVAVYIIAALLLIGLGFGIATWRHRARIAGYDERERQRLDQIAVNDAEQEKLRAENEKIRQHVAELSASEEALKAIIKEHGGSIAVEAKKLGEINEQLKSDQAVISAPADRCTRCKRFSATALANGLISKPLTCADECSGTNP